MPVTGTSGAGGRPSPVPRITHRGDCPWIACASRILEAHRGERTMAKALMGLLLGAVVAIVLWIALTRVVPIDVNF